jgi:3-methyladenine DNA glycosylase AlkD
MTVDEILAALKRQGTRRNREGMARYAIVAPKVFGVPMAAIQRLGRHVGPSHTMALALWKTGWYEARLLAAYVDEPDRVTPAQMDRWARDFDNWAVCDTLCFQLFDRTPHAWTKVQAWSSRREEFVRRAAFALLASLALHDKTAGDTPFLRTRRLIERAATDERNFVKKAVSWALRSVGHRNALLHATAIDTANRLVASGDPTARWIGRDALRDLQRPAVRRRVASATR